jgi:hypothetical protein
MVYRRGMIPLVYSDMELALYAVRRTEFWLIIINGRKNKIDVLETALNIRDIDKDIPVLITGLKGGDKQIGILKKLSEVNVAFDDESFDQALSRFGKR